MKNRKVIQEQSNVNLNNKMSLIKKNIQKSLVKSLSQINNCNKTSNIINNNKNNNTPLIYKTRILPYMTKHKVKLKKENPLNKNKSFNKFRGNIKIPITLSEDNNDNKMDSPCLLTKIKMNRDPKNLKTLKNPLKIYINYNLNKRKLFTLSKKTAKNGTEKILIPEKFIKILNKKTIKKPKFISVESQVNINCSSKIKKRKYSLNNIFDMISYDIENSTNKIKVNTILRRNITDINLQLNKRKEFFISAKGYEEDEEEKNNVRLKLQNILGYSNGEDEKINGYIKSKENNRKIINSKSIQNNYNSCSSEYDFFEKNDKNKYEWNNWKKKSRTKNSYC